MEIPSIQGSNGGLAFLSGIPTVPSMTQLDSADIGAGKASEAGAGLSRELGVESSQRTSQVEEAGQQFEELFVSMLMKQMRDTLEEGLFGDESSDSLGAIFDLYMGKHLAKSSPLGVGQAVKSYLKAGQI